MCLGLIWDPLCVFVVAAAAAAAAARPAVRRPPYPSSERWSHRPTRASATIQIQNMLLTQPISSAVCVRTCVCVRRNCLRTDAPVTQQPRGGTAPLTGTTVNRQSKSQESLAHDDTILVTLLSSRHASLVRQRQPNLTTHTVNRLIRGTPRKPVNEEAAAIPTHRRPHVSMDLPNPVSGT